jgi:hypothetical protein
LRLRAARDAKIQSENLLYIADPGSGGVFVYAYAPPTIKFVEFLTDARAPGGECVDAAAPREELLVDNPSRRTARANLFACAGQIKGDAPRVAPRSHCRLEGFPIGRNS